MQTVHSVDPLRRAVATLRKAGPLALVPTMGALHEGHLTLVREAKKRAASVAVSIFVNPLQFGAGEDLDAYPRQLERDSALLEAEGVDLIWAPTVEVMYPQGFATNISVTGVSEGLCGAARPGHFDGVATVVCKLFQQVLPDVALFGEKDWQQLAVIRRMARDLDLSRPHADRILGVPTVREADGLAMSSRNAYLTEQERQQAASLPAAMKAAIVDIEAGKDVKAALQALETTLLGSGFSAVDYTSLRDADDLTVLDSRSPRPMRLLAAARIGRARLIDNMAVMPSNC
ncbi:pantoate--beta-alanine ligase [Novosphingobium album (ex Hu et al. 2023)]|uniref:Pantothenate synthetase n=1 Tax=Novosphingobium album (ex Hu et al. 2023) TaxID=2930093 RepID=A0ABT0B6Z0_9SPHN|nr:pantoate--beta-alanine ligase [Novosphingobium album (ex Hu et al. 2023)]MCJ2180799.1 pantoate--beta-alanine ligase [Novosphingobium album (ex Hu et al. 2023)]